MAYSRKIYQIHVFHGAMRWTLTDAYSTLDPAIARFEYVINDGAPVTYQQFVRTADGVERQTVTRPHRKDWSNFSYKLVDKSTGETLRRHVGRAAKYARED